MNKGYSSAVSDTLFCNDRSTPGKDATGWSNDTGLGYGINPTAFGATARTGLFNSSTTKSTPKFICDQKKDAFTVSDTSKGNGALTHPVGFITADEIVAAGSGKYGTANSNYYLYKSSYYWYWSLSPCFWNNYANVFFVDTNGRLYETYVSNTLGSSAPVINLSADYAKNMIGSGISTDPYRAAGDTA